MVICQLRNLPPYSDTYDNAICTSHHKVPVLLTMHLHWWPVKLVMWANCRKTAKQIYKSLHLKSPRLQC